MGLIRSVQSGLPEPGLPRGLHSHVMLEPSVLVVLRGLERLWVLSNLTSLPIKRPLILSDGRVYEKGRGNRLTARFAVLRSEKI